MAKQNRKIDIRKRALKERVDYLQMRTHELIAENAALEKKVEYHRRDELMARSELRVITARLRAFCQHTICLPPNGEVGSRDRLMIPPSPHRVFYTSGPHLDKYTPMELVQFIISRNDYDGPGDFRRYLHLNIRNAAPEQWTYAVAMTREALLMMRDPDMAARYVAQEFGQGIAELIRQKPELLGGRRG